jgi:hypothetical protein
MFDNISKEADNAISKGKEYIKLSENYYKLKIFQHFSILLSFITKLALFGSILLIALIFLSISGSIALGNMLDNPALGFLIVGSGLVLIAMIIYLCRRAIDKKIITKISKDFF